MVNLVALVVFATGALFSVERGFPKGRGQLVLASIALFTIISATASAFFGMVTTFTDLVIVTMMAFGVFVLDYAWLSVVNVASLLIWYRVQHSIIHAESQIMEVSSVLFAVVVSFFLCHIRRNTYVRQFGYNQRQRLLSEKLVGIWRDTKTLENEQQQTIEELKIEEETLLKEIQTIESALPRLKNSVKNSRASESLGRLAGGVAHDFNNLLTVLFFNVDELLEVSTEPSVKSDLTEARRVAEKVAELTGQLLGLSRRQVLNRKIVNPRLHIKKLLPTISKLLGEQTRIQLDIDLSVGQFELHADPDLLDRVILALAEVGNSSEKRGGEVTIRLEAKNHESIVYSIIHHHSAPTSHTSLQSPYETGEDLFKGLGLSLAAVEGVIEQHHGVLEFCSESNLTEYKFELPLQAPDPSGEILQLQSPTPVEGSILVIEDDDQVRRLVTRFLKKQGHDVHSFSCLAELKQQDEPIENAVILICDYLQSKSDGMNLSLQLKQRWPAMKTVFMTGPALRETTPLAAEDHFYLPKPFSLKKLGEQIHGFVTT